MKTQDKQNVAAVMKLCEMEDKKVVIHKEITIKQQDYFKVRD